MALAYTTSPAYHLIAEKRRYQGSGDLRRGPLHAGRGRGDDRRPPTSPISPATSSRFMLTDGFQAVIPTTNWMYPAHTPAAGLPAGYETLAKPGKPLLLTPDEAQAERAPALAEWLAALSR